MLDKVSYIIHFRKDTDLREQNLRCVYDFYKSYNSNLQFIIIEDDKTKKLDTSFLNKNDHYIFFENNDIYRRTHCFNLGSLKSDRPLLIFGDSDVIIKPEYISRSCEIVNENNLGIMYPYNGVAVNIKNKLKEEFILNKNYDILENVREEIKLTAGYQTELFTVFNTWSRGGCVLFKHDIFNDINGYNPNFIGWGYEDDEISIRVPKLGYSPGRYTNKKAHLWHLDHDTPTSDKRDIGNRFYRNNAMTSVSVEQMNTEQVKMYCKTWKMGSI